MKTETIRNRTQLTADEGKWLCNETNKVFAHKVILGAKSNEAMWKEVAEEEKTRLEALWNGETPTEPTTEEKAQAYDILMGVAE